MTRNELIEIEKDLDKGVWIPQWLMENKNFTWTKKVIYQEISQLEALDDGCIASNSHFAKKYGITPQGASKAINEMARDEYIFIDNAQVKRNHGSRIITINCGKSPRQETINHRKSAINHRKSAINCGKKTIGNKSTTKSINKPLSKEETEKEEGVEVLTRTLDVKFRQLISELFLRVKSKSKITSLADGTKSFEVNAIADKAYQAYTTINDSNIQIINNFKALEEKYITENKIQMLPRIETFLLDYELKVAELNTKQRINSQGSNNSETVYDKMMQGLKANTSKQPDATDTEIIDSDSQIGVA